MAATCIVTCAALAWAASFVGLGALSDDDHLWRALTVQLLQLTQRTVRRMSSTWPVCLLLVLRPVEHLCDAASRWSADQGRGLTKEECCSVLALTATCSVLLCMILARSVIGLVAPVVAWIIGVPLWDTSMARRRTQELAAQMPGVFRTLAMAMGAGETLAQAIAYVGEHEKGSAGSAFRGAALKMRCGASADEALAALVDELDAPGIGLIATAMLISQRTGSPLRSLFQRSALLVERQGEFERMLAVKTAQVRLSVRIVSLLPVIMVGTLSLISPDFQKGILTAPGAVSLSLAAAMDLLALAIIRKLMKGVL